MKRLLYLLVLCPMLLWATTTKISYRAQNTAMTVTALNSLANSTSVSTGIWGSALVDNTTNLDIDELVTVQVTSGASGVSATGNALIYVYGCLGGTTTCTDGITGSQGTQTLTNPTNLIQVFTCNVVANATAYTCGPFSVANSFGGILPPRWGVIVRNQSGAAFAASGNSVSYDSVQMTNQ